MLLIGFALLAPNKNAIGLYFVSADAMFLKLYVVYFMNLFKQPKQANFVQNKRPVNLCQIKYF